MALNKEKKREKYRKHYPHNAAQHAGWLADWQTLVVVYVTYEWWWGPRVGEEMNTTNRE